MTFLAVNWNPNEIFVDLGIFQIRYYSLMFIIAFGLGWYVMKKIYTKEQLSMEKLDSLFIYAIIATLLGARLGHVFFYDWDYFRHHLLEILLPIRMEPKFEIIGFRGLASHGAAIGVIAAMYIYSKIVLRKPALWILDRVVLCFALGGIFVRIGNLINSEIVGKPTGSDYGFIFRRLGENFPRHPTQLYEAFGYLIVFLILWFVYWKTDKKEKTGFIFGLFLVLLWSVRFLVEFFKRAQVDQRTEWLLNTGQLLSIPFILAGLYFMFSAKKTNQPEQ